MICFSHVYLITVHASLIFPIDVPPSIARVHTVHRSAVHTPDHGPWNLMGRPSRWPCDRALAQKLPTCQKSNLDIVNDKHMPRFRVFQSCKCFYKNDQQARGKQSLILQVFHLFGSLSKCLLRSRNSSLLPLWLLPALLERLLWISLKRGRPRIILRSSPRLSWTMTGVPLDSFPISWLLMPDGMCLDWSRILRTLGLSSVDCRFKYCSVSALNVC